MTNQGGSKQEGGFSPTNSQVENTSRFNSRDDSFLDKGKIPRHLGEGENAKNSVIWLVIRHVLWFHVALVLVLCVYDMVYENAENTLTIIKETWGVFTPILTLSLGYMFGKREVEKNA